MKSRVFAPQIPRHIDPTPAEAFGSLVVMLPPHQITDHMEEAADIIKQKMESMNFNENDYILVAGDPLAIGLAFYYAGQMVKNYSVLKWDRRDWMYIPVDVSLA